MYEKIVYDGHQHVSIATLPGMAERTLTFNGLSKAYAMTGWRLGYVAGPQPYIQQIEKVHSHSVTCATSFVQYAGVAALTGPQEFIGEMVTRLGSPAAASCGPVGRRSTASRVRSSKARSTRSPTFAAPA